MTMFVRSQDNLAVWTNPKASGHILTVSEVRAAFGDEVLDRVLDEGVIPLASCLSEPAETLRRAREALGLTIKDVARRLKIGEQDVKSAESPSFINPIQTIEKIAILLGLDERVLSYSSDPRGSDLLAGRLKELKASKGGSLSVNSVSALSEASWVIRTQYRLMKECGRSRSTILNRFTPDDDYGYSGCPAYRRGYDLAAEARRILGLSPEEPIESLRGLCEKLDIAVVQTELSPKLAGATLAVAGERGIVLNVNGANSNVWVRRATLAHELAHLLWDSDERLEYITVDEYKGISPQVDRNSDRIEARANAFAIAFLAPPDAVVRRFNEAPTSVEGLCSVMDHFGISYSAAKHHIGNCVGGAINVGFVDTLPSDDWVARENFTVDFFPEPDTPISRRGKFAENVVAALDAGIISEDSLARYLNIEKNNIANRLPVLRDIFSGNNEV